MVHRVVAVPVAVHMVAAVHKAVAVHMAVADRTEAAEHTELESDPEAGVAGRTEELQAAVPAADNPVEEGTVPLLAWRRRSARIRLVLVLSWRGLTVPAVVWLLAWRRLLVAIRRTSRGRRTTGGALAVWWLLGTHEIDVFGVSGVSSSKELAMRR